MVARGGSAGRAGGTARSPSSGARDPRAWRRRAGNRRGGEAPRHPRRTLDSKMRKKGRNRHVRCRTESADSPRWVAVATSRSMGLRTRIGSTFGARGVAMRRPARRGQPVARRQLRSEPLNRDGSGGKRRSGRGRGRVKRPPHKRVGHHEPASETRDHASAPRSNATARLPRPAKDVPTTRGVESNTAPPNSIRRSPPSAGGCPRRIATRHGTEDTLRHRRRPTA